MAAGSLRLMDGPELQYALDLPEGVSYAEDMRANRLAANSIMTRAHGEGWEALFNKMLLDATAEDEMWARSASLEDCASEIGRIEDMTAADNYAKVMSEGLPHRVFDAERAAIPVCK